MRFTSEQYKKMLLDLLPRGRAWDRLPGSIAYDFIDAISKEFERVDARANQLIKEADPRSALETLDQWESFLGLPDECTGEQTTIEGRRQEILAKLTALGGISRQYYIDLARALGYEITITEFRPFRAGLSRAGDALTNGDWIYAWRVNAPAVNGILFRAGSGRAGDPLALFSNEVLECVISKNNRASRIVLFAYGNS